MRPAPAGGLDVGFDDASSTPTSAELMFRAPGYCVNCFAKVPADAESCPVCGTVFADWALQPYDQRLIHALRHPLADIRMRAIIALKSRKPAEAIEPLREAAFATPHDAIQGMEIAKALGDFENEAAGTALADIAERHEGALVRAAASGAHGQCP